MLAHDSAGFLIGDVVPDIRRMSDNLTSMRRDIAAIKRAVTAHAAPDANSNANRAARSRSDAPGDAPGPVEPRSRRRTASADTGDATRNRRQRTAPNSETHPTRQTENPPAPSPVNSDPSPQINAESRRRAANSAGANGAPAQPRSRRRRNMPPESPERAQRDARGRFTLNSDDGAQAEEERRQRRLFNGMGEKIADAVSASASGLEEADPMVKAFNEVAEPLTRGYQFFMGGDRDERWYRKLFGELRLFRKDQTAFNRAEQRTLREIEDNTELQPRGGSGSGGGGGGVLHKIANFLGIGASGGVAGRVLGGLGGGIGRLLGGVGRGALRLGGGLLRRIPLIGGLFAGASAIEDVYENENDGTLTRREKDMRNSSAIGGATGTIGGMMAGAAAGSLLGPVGTIVGGAVGAFLGDQGGQILGEKIGEWTNGLREYDLPGKVMEVWNHLTDSFQVGWEDIKKKWGDFVNKAVAGWDHVTGMFKSAYEGLKKLPIIGPAIQAAEDAVKKSAELAEKGIAKGIEEAKKLPAKAQEKLNQGVEWAEKNTTIGKGLSKFKDLALPKKIQERWADAKQFLSDAAEKAGVDPGIVAKIAGFESGFNAEARPVRKRDGKVLSSAHGYGQFLDSTWVDMVRKHGEKYGIANAGDLSKADALKLRSNKDLQASLLAEFTKENIEKGRQYGAGNDDANVYALHNLGAGDGQKFLRALKRNTQAKISDILSAQVISGNKSLYGDGSITLADAYNNMAAAMARNETFAKDIRLPTAAPMPAQVASAAAPSLPPLPKPQVIAEAPPMVIPMAGGLGQKSLSVSLDKGDIGQDVSDRRIAHIVTGGLSS